MKLSILVLCLFAVTSAAETGKDLVASLVTKFKKLTADCIAESKASEDDVKLLTEHKIPETHEGKCFIFCFHKYTHLQNEDGSLNKEKALEGFLPIKETNEEMYNKLASVLNTCVDAAEENSDPCLYASNIAECGLREGKDMDFAQLIVIE